MNKKNICLASAIVALGIMLSTAQGEIPAQSSPSNSGTIQNQSNNPPAHEPANNPAPAMQIKPLPTPPPVMKSPDRITTEPQPAMPAQTIPPQEHAQHEGFTNIAPAVKPDLLQKITEQISNITASTQQQMQAISALDLANLKKKRTELFQQHVNKASDLDQAFSELKRLSQSQDDITKNSAAIQVQLNRIINDTTALVSTHIVMDAIESKK